jgi:hypothetical protein
VAVFPGADYFMRKEAGRAGGEGEEKFSLWFVAYFEVTWIYYRMLSAMLLHVEKLFLQLFKALSPFTLQPRTPS